MEHSDVVTLVVAVISFVGTAVSLLWNSRQQSGLKRLERESQEYMVIRKTQFEKEFKTYDALSKVLGELVRIFIELNIIFALKNDATQTEDVREKCSKEHERLLIEVPRLLLNNSAFIIAIKPFIDPEIAVKLDELWVCVQKTKISLDSQIDVQPVMQLVDTISGMIARKIRPLSSL